MTGIFGKPNDDSLPPGVTYEDIDEHFAQPERNKEESMTEAEADVNAVVDHYTEIAHGAIEPTALFAAMIPRFVSLILERLDSLETELQFIEKRIGEKRS